MIAQKIATEYLEFVLRQVTVCEANEWTPKALNELSIGAFIYRNNFQINDNDIDTVESYLKKMGLLEFPAKFNRYFFFFPLTDTFRLAIWRANQRKQNGKQSNK